MGRGARRWWCVLLCALPVWAAAPPTWQGLAVTPPSAADLQASRAIEDYLYALQALQQQAPPTEVVAQLTRAIAQNPNVATLYYQRAQLYRQMKEWDKALADAKQASLLDPAKVAPHILYAKLLTVSDRLPEAIAHLQKLLQVFPRSTRIYTNLARFYGQQGDFLRVEATLKRLTRVRPDSFRAAYGLGTLYAVNLRRPAAALAQLRRAVQLRPGDTRANLALAQLYLDAKNPRAALRVLQTVEDAGAADVAVQLRMAMLYYDLRDYPEAIRRLESVLIGHPQSDKLRYYLGVLYEESGNRAAAMTAFTLVPVHSALFKDAQLRLAVASAQAGKPADAIARLRTALVQRKDIQPFYEYLAYLQEQQKDLSGAVATLQRAIRQFPRQIPLLYAAALLHDRLGRQDAAVRLMREVLKNDAKNVTALNYVGFMAAERGRRLDEAETLLQKAVQLQPNDGHVVDSLAWLYFRKGDYEHAQQLIQHAQRLSPSEPAIMRHHAHILLKLGNIGEARAWLRMGRTIAMTRNADGDAAELALIEKLLKTLDTL